MESLPIFPNDSGVQPPAYGPTSVGGDFSRAYLPSSPGVQPHPAFSLPKSDSSFFGRLLEAGETFFSGLTNTLRGVGRDISEGLSSIGSGFVDLFSGNFSSGVRSIGEGLLSTFAQTPIDALLIGGGSFVSAIQTALGLEPPGEKLSSKEISELRSIFGDSIDYISVKIKEGDAGIFGLTGRAFALGNTIYLPREGLRENVPLLVHEMTHIWQHQNGGTDYLSEALWAQNFGEGYEVENALQTARPWETLNPEQQAEIARLAYITISAEPSASAINSGAYYSDYLQRALEELRAGRGA